MIGSRLALLFLYTFLLFGCAATQKPHSAESPASNAGLEGESNRYNKILNTAGSTLKEEYKRAKRAAENTLKEEYKTARNDIKGLKSNLNPFSRKTAASAKTTILEAKTATKSIESPSDIIPSIESPSDIIPSIEGIEVEEVYALGKSSTLEVEGEKYKHVWEVAENILKETSTIVDNNKEKGILKGDLRPFSNSWGEIINITINPANIESEKYSIKVVTKTKSASLSGYNWTPDIIRAIKYSLGMKVVIEEEIEYKRPLKKGKTRPKTKVIILNSDPPETTTEESEDDETVDLLLPDVSVEQFSAETADENPQQISTDEEAEQEIADEELQPDSTAEELISDTVDKNQQTKKPDDEEQAGDDESNDLLLPDVSVEQFSAETTDENPLPFSTDEEAEPEIAEGELPSDSTE